MSMFTPFRSPRVRTSALVVGGLIKAASYVEAQQRLPINVSQVGGQNVAYIPAICDNSTGVLSTAINIGTTQVQVVAGSTRRIYVCGFNFTTGDSSNVVKWVEGTSTDCISGQADLSGPMNFSSKSGISSPSGNAVQFKTSSGASLCIDATSTGVYGMLTYISST